MEKPEIFSHLPPITVIFLFLFFFSCKPNLDIPEPMAGDADFSSTVAIGGNFLAGYQDGALYDKGQKNSIPSLLAARFQLMKGSDCPPPMMPDEKGLGLNSKLWESAFVTKSILGYKTDCKGKSSLSPLKGLFGENVSSAYLNKATGTIRNLSVPFASIKDLFNPALGIAYGPNNKNPFYSRFATNRGSSTVFSDAMKLDPTFAIVWVGMEDIYEYARAGGEGKSILPVSEFSLSLDAILKPLAEKGSKGVIANIPELKCFPFYSLIPWNGLELTDSTAHLLDSVTGYFFNFRTGKNGFLIVSNTESMGFRASLETDRILLTIPLDSLKCEKMGSAGDFIPDKYVLDKDEKKNVDLAIKAYNKVIQEKAAQFGFAFADMNYFFKKMIVGIRWDGVDYNTSFVSGGFFSLDGYHPNQKGYEMIANEFIAAINSKYKAVVPTVNCPDCMGVLFP